MVIKERDMPSYSTVTDIYNLFLEENWREMQSFYEDNKFDVFLPLNHLRDTALHLAVYSEDVELVETLLKMVYTENPFGLEFPFANASGNTPLHEAASIGNFKLVRLIMNYDHDHKLLNTLNENGETPFFMAALYGKTTLIKEWAEHLKDIDHHVLSTTSTMLHEAIRGCYFDTALELLDPKYCIPKGWVDRDGMTCFQLLADIPSAFKSGYSPGKWEKLSYHGLPDPEDKDESENNNVSQVNSGRNTDAKHGNSSKYFRWIWRPIAIVVMNIGIWLKYPSFQILENTKKKHGIVVKLTKILAEDDKSWQGYNTADGAMPNEYNNSTDDDQRDTPLFNKNTNDDQRDTPLIAAAKNGITEIVEAILDVFPQAIENENHKKENVFHVAVQNRRTKVLDLLKSYKFDYSRLIWKFNADGEGILHKAAYKSDISSRERPGEALGLQSDIQWFELVRKMVPGHHANQQNKKKEKDTPQSLFTKEHKEMVKKGQEWLIRTTNSCIIVAVLIATVAFTSIYTVPGGSDAKTGKPLLLNTTTFTVFTASDVASLCFAFTSVVVFLSITTSKMNEQDFRTSLPLKLVFGLSMLFFSVAALMIGFAATLVMTLRHRLHRAAAPIIAIACYPVAFFLLLQLRLYANITLFTINDLLRSLIDIIPKKCQPRSWTRSSLSLLG